MLKKIVILSNLQVWPIGTEVGQLGDEGGQDGVNWRKDRSTISTGQKKIGQTRDDQDGGLGPDVGEGGLEVGLGQALDDLCGLHWWPWGDIEPGHVASDICVTHNREKRVRWHFKNDVIKKKEEEERQL